MYFFIKYYLWICYFFRNILIYIHLLKKHKTHTHTRSAVWPRPALPHVTPSPLSPISLLLVGPICHNSVLSSSRSILWTVNAVVDSFDHDAACILSRRIACPPCPASSRPLLLLPTSTPDVSSPLPFSINRQFPPLMKH
jgi:hypothetical protein